MELKIFTDGGSLNNPGQAACAYVIYLNNKVVESNSQTLGIATNNSAEYQGVILALTKVKELLATNNQFKGVSSVKMYSDSNLLVNQLNGLFKVKNGAIREYIMKVRILEQEIKIPISYTYVPREQNALADSLVKRAFGRQYF